MSSSQKADEPAHDDDLQRLVDAARSQDAEREQRPLASRRLLDRMQAELPPAEMLEAVLQHERARR